MELVDGVLTSPEVDQLLVCSGIIDSEVIAVVVVVPVQVESGEGDFEFVVGRCGPEVLFEVDPGVTGALPAAIEEASAIGGDGSVVHDVVPTEAGWDDGGLVGLAAVGGFDGDFGDDGEGGITEVYAAAHGLVLYSKQGVGGGGVGDFPGVTAPVLVGGDGAPAVPSVDGVREVDVVG